MKQVIISLTDTQWKAMSIYTPDPDEWANSAVTAYADRCIDEIFLSEVQRMSLDPTTTTIPADRGLVVDNCDLPTAIQKNAEIGNQFTGLGEQP
jgi:hypothetical protein